MKNVKRILSMILVSVMVLTMALPAFAAGEGTITITNTQAANLKYEAYQVFKGDVEEGKLTNIEWGNGVNGDTLLAALKADGTVGQFFANCTTAAEVAKAMEPLTDDSAAMQAMSVIVSDHLATKAGESTQNTSPYTITGLDIGYYFVKDVSGLATADNRASKYAMVNVLDDKATIAIKTVVPTQEKKVKENQAANVGPVEDRQTYGEGFNDTADYNINDVVDFELLSTVPNFKGSKTYYYEFQDEYDTAFTLDKDSIKVEVVSKDNVENVLKTLTLNTDYTLQYVDTAFVNGAGRNAKQFNVIIEDLVKTLGEQYIGEKIKVTFKATLNEGAVIGRPGNRNRSRLIYGNNPNEKGEPTPWDEVVVFTYELDANKVDGEDANKKLKDAEFVFYKEVNNVKTYVQVNAQGRVTGWTTDKAQASILKSDANGQFAVIGIDEGTYYLEETKAPTGYNLLKDVIKVEIVADTYNTQNLTPNDTALRGTTINIDDKGAAHTPGKPVGIEGVDIENNQGVELPETGGMGTTLFYVIGALLMIGAGVVLVTRRRVR